MLILGAVLGLAAVACQPSATSAPEEAAPLPATESARAADGSAPADATIVAKPPAGDAAAATGPAATPAASPASALDADANDAPVPGATPPSPRPLVTLVPVPTPGPAPTPIPIPTPVPPSAALQPTASGLATRLTAFRAAMRIRDMDSLLRLQRELLTAADQAQAALKDDRSRQAEAVRGAIADLRAGAAGDANGLEHAEAALRQVLGGLAVAPAAAAAPRTPVPDLSRVVDVMNEQLRSFRQAVRDRNAEGALRLQGELLNSLSIAAEAAQHDQSERGRVLRAALDDLRRGLEGDAELLAGAGAALGRLGSSPSQTVEDIPRLAASLASKLDAFRAAVATGSRGELLRLQQDILAEAGQAEGALRFDESPPASALRQAIAAIGAGVSGDFARLDEARATVGKLSGEQAALAADGAPIADLPRFARDLEGKVATFQEAVQKNDTGGMLRLQRELMAETERAATALKDVHTPAAEPVHAAVAALRTAFAGDLGKLSEAIRQLRATSGSAERPRNGVSPTPSAAQVDVQPLANELRNKLTGLREAVRDRQPPEEIARRRAALNAEATKVEEALRGATDPNAARLRALLGAVHEAASGDDAKFDVAGKALDESLQAR